jgi:hypothetical protein
VAVSERLLGERPNIVRNACENALVVHADVPRGSRRQRVRAMQYDARAE